MYDDTKEEIIAKLKVLSDTKRMMLLNKYLDFTICYCGPTPGPADWTTELPWRP